MTSRINQLLEEIRTLEEDLAEAIKTQELEFYYRLEGTRVRFEKAVKQAHKKLKVGSLAWLAQSSPRNLISAPIIYFMIIPFAVLDICVTIYQWTCFPLYRIARVKRSDHIAIDRHKLSYLNSLEKFNCVYCGYMNGLIAYTREIASRTEQYWCPVKHARKILDPHRRYHRFADFGDPQDHHQHVREMRKQLVDVNK